MTEKYTFNCDDPGTAKPKQTFRFALLVRKNGYREHARQSKDETSNVEAGSRPAA
jgi:hypothetical protein